MRELFISVSILSVQIGALVVFFLGFFQFRPSAPPVEASGCSTLRATLRATLPANPADALQPVFDKMVFMLIDALRADFVYDVRRFPLGFNWLRSVMREDAMSVVAMAAAPTVTLPRLKALTAGTAPVFLDLLFNLNESSSNLTSPSQAMDSWVERLYGQSHSILHYGDDTWLRLFPGLLHPDSKGTHSFLVTDTVECDRNVTIHLDAALERRDWTALSLHYLGLDHVGHVGGITSPLLVPKMQEMDGIARRIFEAIQLRDAKDGTRTLMVILGDHGMTDAGNHGGASPAETRTACIFLSPHYQRQGPDDPLLQINQVDVAPTISALLGLGPLRDSTGRCVSGLIPPFVVPEEKLTLLGENAFQLCRLMGDVRLDLLQEAVMCHVESTRPRDECIKLYESFLSRASDSLQEHAGWYDSRLLLIGSLLSISSLLLAALWRPVMITTFVLAGLSSVFIQHLWVSQTATCDWCIVLIGLALLLVFLSLYLLQSLHGQLTSIKTFKSLLQARGTLVLMMAAYAICMFASTFIEEEHEIWYHVFPTLLILKVLRQSSALSSRSSVGETMVILILFRLLRYWNSTGYLHRDDADIKLFITSQSWPLQLAYLATTLGLLLVGLQVHPWPRSRLLLSLVCAGCCVCYKFGLLASIVQQRSALFLHLLLILVSRAHISSLALFFIFLLKLHNALPILILAAISSRLCTPHSPPPYNSQSSLAIRIALLHAAYFVLGPCHLVASIDFSPAYLGQTQFDPLTTGILGWISTWAGPLLTFPSLLLGINRTDWSDLPWILLWRSVVHLAVLSSTALQRHHLFVWTVFAPRLLFELGWTLLYSFIVLLMSCWLKRS